MKMQACLVLLACLVPGAIADALPYSNADSEAGEKYSERSPNYEASPSYEKPAYEKPCYESHEAYGSQDAYGRRRLAPCSEVEVHHKCHQRHCDHFGIVGTLAVGGFVLIGSLLFILSIQAVFNMKDVFSFVTQQIWGFLEALFHMQRIQICGTLLIMVLFFCYLLMATHFGYIHCEECGREHWYIRWFAWMFAGPILMMMACDLSLIGFQIQLAPDPITGFLGNLLKLFLPNQEPKIQAALGFLEAVLNKNFGTDSARGFKWSLMGASFIQNLCLALATLTCGPMKWAFFAMSLVFFIPQTHALWFVLPQAMATLDPTLKPAVKTLLEKHGMESLIGALFRMIRGMTFILWLMIMLQSWIWVLSVGMPFWCADTAAVWFMALDTLTFLLPQTLGLLGWPFTIGAIMQAFLLPRVTDALDGINTDIVPLSSNAAPGSKKNGKNEKTGGFPNAEDDDDEDEEDEPMQLDANRCLDPPNEMQGENYLIHAARCLLFGSRNTKVMWNLCTHSHIGQSYLDHIALGKPYQKGATLDHFDAVINMLHHHGEL